MQIHSTGPKSPLPSSAPKTTAVEDSLVNHVATNLGYCRLDEDPCEEAVPDARVHAPSVRVGGTPPHPLEGTAKPTSLVPLSATRRREFAAQFRDLFHPIPGHQQHQQQQPHDNSGTARPLVSWDDASRLFQTQFGIPSSVALTIWKQVDSDGDLKLDEAEYCLAASLAEKVASTGGSEVNGTAHGLENEALESAVLRPFETSSLLDESRDLLLSPASASLLTPDVSAAAHPDIWTSSDTADQSKDPNAEGLHFAAGAHPAGIAEDQKGEEVEEEEEDDEEEEENLVSSASEENEAGVAALLPTPGSQRGIIAKVNESLLMRSSTCDGGAGVSGDDADRDDDDDDDDASSSAASSSSFASSSSSSSSSPASSSFASSSSPRARFLDYDRHHPPHSDSSCEARHVSSEAVDPITLLAGITGRDAGLLRSLPKCRRRRVLARMESLSKFINHTLLRLNNELAGELQELCDQQVNLNVQVHHLSLIHQQQSSMQQQHQQQGSTELLASPPPLSPVLPRKFS